MRLKTKDLPRLLATGCLTTVGAIFFILGWQEEAPCACWGPELFGQKNLGTIGRSQRAYWIENQKFGESLEAIDLPLTHDSYNRYTMAIDSNKVISRAIPHENSFAPIEVSWYGLFPYRKRTGPPLHSSVGAVFLLPNEPDDFKKFVSVVCRATEPGIQRLPSPELSNGEGVCKGATERVSKHP